MSVLVGTPSEAVYTMGVDTPGGIGCWSKDGPIYAHQAKDMSSVGVLFRSEILPAFGPPAAIIVEKPHGITPATMHMQQDVLSNAVSAGYVMAKLDEFTEEAWLLPASRWRSKIGISGDRKRCKMLARALAERSFAYLDQEVPKLSEHCCEGLCIAMAAWLMFVVKEGEVDDTLVQMLSFPI